MTATTRRVAGQRSHAILAALVLCAALPLSIMVVRYTAFGVLVAALCLFGIWGLLRAKRKGYVDLLPAFLVTVLPLTVFIWGIDLDRFVPVHVFYTGDKMPAMVMALCFAVLLATWALSRKRGHTARQGGFRLLFGLAGFMFVIVSGYFSVFAYIAGPYFFFLIIVVGLVYFIARHFRRPTLSEGGGGPAKPLLAEHMRHSALEIQKHLREIEEDINRTKSDLDKARSVKSKDEAALLQQHLMELRREKI